MQPSSRAYGRIPTDLDRAASDAGPCRASGIASSRQAQGSSSLGNVAQLTGARPHSSQLSRGGPGRRSRCRNGRTSEVRASGAARLRSWSSAYVQAPAFRAAVVARTFTAPGPRGRTPGPTSAAHGPPGPLAITPGRITKVMAALRASGCRSSTTLPGQRGSMPSKETLDGRVAAHGARRISQPSSRAKGIQKDRQPRALHCGSPSLGSQPLAHGRTYVQADTLYVVGEPSFGSSRGSARQDSALARHSSDASSRYVEDSHHAHVAMLLHAVSLRVTFTTFAQNWSPAPSCRSSSLQRPRRSSWA